MKQTMTLMGAILMAFVVLNSTADEKKLKAQETCPVMKEKIDKSLYADVNGKRVYVCCKGCIKTIKKSPDKFLKKLDDMGETPATLQTKCPVMGGAINKDLYVDVEGKRIYVCCKGCEGPITKDPASHIKKIAEAGEVPYDAPVAEKPEKDLKK